MFEEDWERREVEHQKGQHSERARRASHDEQEKRQANIPSNGEQEDEAIGHEVDPRVLQDEASSRSNQDTKGEFDQQDEEFQAWLKNGGQYPWYAPRVLMQYFEITLQYDGPGAWSIDNYDGAVTWMDFETQPNELYRHNADTTPAQSRELRKK